MQLFTSIQPRLPNSVIEFRKDEWDSLSNSERENIFSYYSVVVRCVTEPGAKLDWTSPTIREFFDFFVERQAHGVSCYKFTFAMFNLKKNVFQELSKRLSNNFDTNSRIVRATLNDLDSNRGDSPLAVLNFLSIPHSTDRISDLNLPHSSVRYVISLILIIIICLV